MTGFVLILVAFTAIAVALLVLPLLRRGRRPAASRADTNVSVYRDQFAELERDLSSGTLTSDQFGQAHAELERRMLEDVDSTALEPNTGASRSGLVGAVAVAFAVPVCATLLYLHLGNPQGLSAPKHAAIDASSISLEQFKNMTDKLAARMENNPNDPIGWMMLGRAYKSLERYPDAMKALERAEKLDPRNPEILVEYAEAIALGHGGNLEGAPTRLLESALQIAPDNDKALTLAGTAAFGRNDYASAIRYWQRLAAKIPSDSELGRALSSGIAEAKARAAGKAPVASAPQRGPDAPKAPGASQSQRQDASKAVSGVVRLSPSFAAKASAEQTVFIFARAVQGPRMPLAVLRKQVKDLPLSFKLDDSMAMASGLELSSFPRVIVGARISKSGTATPAPGDLLGASQPVEPGASGVVVVIDSQVP